MIFPKPKSAVSRRLVLRLEFHGKGYCGWQLQSEQSEAQIPSIQGTIERALKMLLRSSERIPTQGSGRTDSGVHAREYFCSFIIPESLDFSTDDENIEKLRRSLNGVLPESIAVTHAFRHDDDFHVIDEIAWKTYEYTILFRESKAVHGQDLMWSVVQDWKNFDSRAFLKALPLFEGTHDFKAFAAADHAAQSTVRNIIAVRCITEPYGLTSTQDAGVLVRLRITGQGFLKQMVRNIVGTLVEVGQGKRSVEDVSVLISEARSRAEAGYCAPAQGLSLVQISYEPWGTES